MPPWVRTGENERIPDFHRAVGDPDLDVALGALSHTVDVLAHEIAPGSVSSDLVTDIDTLTHSLDLLLPPTHIIGGTFLHDGLLV